MFSVQVDQQIAATDKKRRQSHVIPVCVIKFGIILRTGKALGKRKIHDAQYHVQDQEDNAPRPYRNQVPEGIIVVIGLAVFA